MQIPGIIENERILLRLINKDDIAKLEPHIYESTNWSSSPFLVSTPEEADIYYANAERDRTAGTRFLYTIYDKSNAVFCGCTAYGNISVPDKRLEIGWTWLGTPFRRTGINRAVKHLLLKTAFEELGCVRVEFKTGSKNMLSRNALKGIGATEEGILRSHTLLHTGQYRDTVYFSILAHEWPAVKEKLFARK